MNIKTFATDIAATGLFPDATGIYVGESFDGRNTNNSGILQCFQNSPGAGATTIVPVAFTLQGSVDGASWGTILTVTTATAPTTTVDGGIFKAVQLAPYLRVQVTTAPNVTAGTPTVPTKASFRIAW